MLQEKIKLDIFMHAKFVYPNECCGVVIQKSRVQKFIPISNVHPDPENAFLPDATEYMEATSLEGWDLVTVVHSHCGDGASTIPSVSDIANCNEHMIPYTIVSIPEGDMRIVQPESMPLIGRPWSLGTYDCWGLIMEFHKIHGIELNDYRVDSRWWAEGGGNFYHENWEREGFIKKESLEFGDMVIFQISSPVWNHAGIYVGNNQLLHHTENKLSRRDIYGGWYEDHSVLICRHRGLNSDIHQNY